MPMLLLSKSQQNQPITLRTQCWSLLGNQLLLIN